MFVFLIVFLQHNPPAFPTAAALVPSDHAPPAPLAEAAHATRGGADRGAHGPAERSNKMRGAGDREESEETKATGSNQSKKEEGYNTHGKVSELLDDILQTLKSAQGRFPKKNRGKRKVKRKTYAPLAGSPARKVRTKRERERERERKNGV